MRHSWKKTPATFEEGVGKIKNWECKKCGCTRQLGTYKFAEYQYLRSTQVFTKSAPVCVEMGRRSNEPLD